MALNLLFFRKINPDMQKQYFFIIFLWVGTLFISSSNMPIDEPKVILCFGNSITAGHGLDPEFAYPFQLEQIIREKGYNYKVINSGLSGETSAGGLTRIDWVLRDKVDIFILELGANDGLRGLPLIQTRSNLGLIIKKVKKKYPDAQIVIAGMMVPPNMGNEYSTEFMYMFNELATEHNALLIPFLLDGVGGIPELNLGDGIHPNIEGHKIVAENVFAFIKDIL
jgi:acyl-CoA thioesterase-1